MTGLGAREFIGLLADGGTWESWDLPAGDAGASTDYADASARPYPGSPQKRSTTRQPPTSSSTSAALQANNKDNKCLIPLVG